MPDGNSVASAGHYGRRICRNGSEVRDSVVLSRFPLPVSVNPLLILLPSAALLGAAVCIAAAKFKKYL
ncbi:MAG: hypothetical protein CRU78_11425 [Candidatus Accumulibacter phosphatis]|uniref:Uncharacterized protein n=1 Tax=Candidatus Accumulibacter phosphatis TaxID=327160 RepID=A0A6A7RVE3_9PROT|nr:hypothetical protein [Candidatus Accumulibacter phosphatis]